MDCIQQCLVLDVNQDTTVITLIAMDTDSTNLDYTILRGNENDFFRIGSSSGIVQSNRALDRESIPVFNLVIIAEDEGGNNGTTQLRIVLTDVNDERPVFQQPSYTAFIDENSREGTPILPSMNGTSIPIQAIDADQPNTPNSMVSYSLAGPNAIFFNIDSSTGIVTVARGE